MGCEAVSKEKRPAVADVEAGVPATECREIALSEQVLAFRVATSSNSVRRSGAFFESIDITSTVIFCVDGCVIDNFIIAPRW